MHEFRDNNNYLLTYLKRVCITHQKHFDLWSLKERRLYSIIILNIFIDILKDFVCALVSNDVEYLQ